MVYTDSIERVKCLEASLIVTNRLATAYISCT